MTDRYTKIVLTVIAISLSILAVEQGVSKAEAQDGAMCGAGPLTPCFVKWYASMPVHIQQ